MKKNLLFPVMLLTNFIGYTLGAQQEPQESAHNVVLIPGTVVESKTQEIIEQLKRDPKFKAKIEALQAASKK